MDNLSVTAFKYAFFAAISTILNLSSQFLSLMFYRGPASLYVAMAAGTLVGLISKYLLDKHYIFGYTSENRIEDAKNFVIYSMTGVATTAVFWVTEILFDAVYANEHAKYLGAIVGLSIGYTAKYFLDRKYVFSSPAQ